MDLSLIFFAAMSLIFAYILYTQLGSRGGHEPSRNEHPLKRYMDGNTDEVQKEDVKKDNSDTVQHVEEVQPEWVRAVQEKYPAFDEARFLSGAQSAYEMIVVAFGTMNLHDVKIYLEQDVYNAFDQAIAARSSRGEVTKLNFVGVEKAEITQHEIVGNDLLISVKFLSNQIRYVTDKNNNTVDGDANRIDLVRDHWRFKRSLSAKDPNWLLDATGLAL